MKTIPPFKLIPEPQSDEARDLPKFKWVDEEIGTRHQLGGEPTFVNRPPSWPICRSCRNKMTFYAQLDSINDEFCLADCGMIYVFVCFDCYESVSLVQSN